MATETNKSPTQTPSPRRAKARAHPNLGTPSRRNRRRASRSNKPNASSKPFPSRNEASSNVRCSNPLNPTVAAVTGKRALLLLPLLAFSALLAHGQGSVRISASTLRPMVGMSETVVYRLTLEGADIGRIGTPEPPETEGLALANPFPTARRETTVARGIVVQRLIFEWTYRPLREGTATFRPLTLRAGSATYTTDAVTVTVRGQGSPALGGPPPAVSSSPAPPPLTTDLTEQDVFVRASVSSNRARVNEQILVEYHLYFKPNLIFNERAGIRLAEGWDAPDFWREELEVSSNPVPDVVTIGQTTYKRITLKHVALFPTREGTLRVSPLRIEARVAPSTRTRLLGMQDLAGPEQSIVRGSGPVTVQVSALPSAPAGFSGAVGALTLSAEASRTEIEPGQSTRIRVAVQGRGNLGMVQVPELVLPDGLEALPGRVERRLTRDASGVSGIVTQDIDVVARQPGRYALPALSLVSWNPATGTYATSETAPIELRVIGAPIPDATPSAPERPAAPASRPLALWVVLALVALAVLGGIAALFLRRRSRSTAAPTKDAPQPLQVPQPLMKAQDFYPALEQVLRQAVGQTQGVPASGLTHAELLELCRAKPIPPKTLQGLTYLLNQCTLVQFAGHIPHPAEQQQDAQHASEVLRGLQKR